MKRIGIFGGSFDPPHQAHVELARTALQALALDEVRWIPAGQPWQKMASARAMTPAPHREAMVRLAIAGEPGFVVDRIEIEREGPSLTLDTVVAFQAAEPGAEWVLLIGGDQYANLHTWRHWTDLLDRVTLAVAQRPGVTREPDAAVQHRPHRAVPLPMLDISSTDIRQRVSRGLGIEHLVPPAVARYIEQNGLYREGKVH